MINEEKKAPLAGILLCASVAWLAVGWILPLFAQAQLGGDAPSSYHDAMIALASVGLMLLFYLLYSLPRYLQSRKESLLKPNPLQQDFTTFCGVKPVRLPAYIFAILLATVCFFSFQFAKFAYYALAYALTKDPGVLPLVEELPELRTLFIWSVVYCVFPAIVEEFFFRDMIFKQASKRNTPYAFCLSTTLFVFAHGSAAQAIQALFLALLLSTLYYVSGSLMLPIIVHMLYNLWGIAATYVFIPPYHIIYAYFAGYGVMDFKITALLYISLAVLLASVVPFLLYRIHKGCQATALTHQKLPLTPLEWIGSAFATGFFIVLFLLKTLNAV